MRLATSGERCSAWKVKALSTCILCRTFHKLEPANTTSLGNKVLKLEAGMMLALQDVNGSAEI